MGQARVRERRAGTTREVDPVVSRARWLLLALYALNGLWFSSWMSRMPSIRDGLGVTTADLGLVTVAGSVGSLVTVTVAGALVVRFGGRRVMLVSTAGFVGSAVLIGLGTAAGSVPVFAVGVLFNGASFALANVPLNVETAGVERRLGRTVIPQFHAAFSIGSVLGAVLGALAARAGVSVLVHVLAVIAVATAVRVVAIPHVVLDSGHTVVQATSAAVPARSTGVFAAWTERRTLLVGVVMMAAAVSEGAANTWLSLAVVDGFGADESTGAMVFGLFVAAMTTVRLVGPRLIDRYGRVRVLAASGIVSLMGLLTFGLAPTLGPAAVGVVAWGFGAALAVPIGIAAASDDPALAAPRVGVVSAFSSTASLAAPPLLGLAVAGLGAHHALLLISVAMVASAAVSGQVRRVPPAAVGGSAAPGAADASADGATGTDAVRTAAPGPRLGSGHRATGRRRRRADRHDRDHRGWLAAGVRG